jgi:hypothetical protein
MSESDSTDTVIMVASPFVGALVGFAIAFWLWPWLGPQILNPCPQWTGLGIGLYAGWHAFKSIGVRMKTVELERIKKRLDALERNDITSVVSDLRKAAGIRR